MKPAWWNVLTFKNQQESVEINRQQAGFMRETWKGLQTLPVDETAYQIMAGEESEIIKWVLI